VLADDTAVQEGVFVVKRPNPADSTRSEFSALLVRSGGKWHFGQLRESPEAASLQELAWLVGSWTYFSDGDKVTATTMTGSASGADSETVKSTSFSVPNPRI
jgi:hypothetical protein